ncbi:1-aminocyclopropane-1-carboxylate deaminase/D-cysteine desulfhydrase-like pyridoxal-dependent ACC family enzyme [Acinetobacter calcoaceticus]|uniref:1-aminocyclopropane-1-carboxylate deaminase/D-cysteine desulfhydrase-like pyridoxal-dependent ACC family enzyme n=1 Tax=Acinetobacter calcoaceticus TaxID=471 RepID=A0A4R1XTW3_ACICA|nr:1-aminocyclopropane-1-carboxylate deaminase/D-cysteine desulfhydrase-like pyridoxal-dependent ACC family enzyme [Acinetobacter calcoaceticus]
MQQQFDQIAQAVSTQSIVLADNVQLTIKRLDQIHPQISGNKFFKLKYNLIEAKSLGYRQILTFGGAYSNHIAATAYAAALFGFESIGIIRGEELAQHPLNPTLATAQSLGMQLQFVSRQSYREKHQAAYLAALELRYPHAYIVPEGGSNALAVQGCQEILSLQDRQDYDQICAAVGTGGTLAGIIEASSDQQQVLGFSALKGDFLHAQVQQYTDKCNWRIIDDYCCGGYAKTSTALLQFIEDFELAFTIPIEPIYTGKMLYGIFDLISKGHFKAGTRILAIHSGGLQGKAATA